MDISEQQYRELKEEKLRRYIEEPHRFYVPIGAVEKFLNGFLSGKYFVSLLSAANGVGKTTSIAATLANLFWPVNNEYFQQPMMKKWPFKLKKGRIISDPTTVTETIIPALKQWFPKGRYTTDKLGKRYEYRWKTDTGWSFDIMSYEQSPKEFESANLSFAVFDEPPPEVIYKATVARMREGGTIGIFATPLIGSAWMYDEIIANQDNDKVARYFVEADVEEACIKHGTRGFLEHDNIIKMVNQYDDEDMQARIFGKFQHLTGLVYKKFSKHVHIIDPFDINRRDYLVSHALDTHPRNPDAVLWMAVDKNGTKFVVDEVYQSLPVGELAQVIKDKDAFYRMDKRLADPSAFNVDQHSGRSWSSDLYKYGLVYTKGSKRRMDAIKRTKEAIDYRMVGNEMVKPPELYIFSTCTRLIWEMQHWQWEEWSGKAAEKKSPREKPQDKDDHEIENLGRLLIEELQWRPKVAEEEKTSILRSEEYDPY